MCIHSEQDSNLEAEIVRLSEHHCLAGINDLSNLDAHLTNTCRLKHSSAAWQEDSLVKLLSELPEVKRRTACLTQRLWNIFRDVQIQKGCNCSWRYSPPSLWDPWAMKIKALSHVLGFFAITQTLYGQLWAKEAFKFLPKASLCSWNFWTVVHSPKHNSDHLFNLDAKRNCNSCNSCNFELEVEKQVPWCSKRDDFKTVNSIQALVAMGYLPDEAEQRIKAVHQDVQDIIGRHCTCKICRNCFTQITLSLRFGRCSNAFLMTLSKLSQARNMVCATFSVTEWSLPCRVDTDNKRLNKLRLFLHGAALTWCQEHKLSQLAVVMQYAAMLSFPGQALLNCLSTLNASSDAGIPLTVSLCCIHYIPDLLQTARNYYWSLKSIYLMYPHPNTPYYFG